MTDKKDEALKLALGYMDGTLMTEHLTGYERKRHVMQSIREALAEQPAQQQSCYCPNCEALSKELAAIKAQQQEPVAFLANGTRFKMSFFENEDEPGTHVTCFEAFEKELDGRWVALVPAEDDSHLKLTSPPASKPWVGLTDEEAAATAYKGFDEYWTEDCNGSETEAWAAAGRAIEAKLKEKQNDTHIRTTEAA